jgi:CBS domain-containing protein
LVRSLADDEGDLTMKVQEILQAKGSAVYSISPDATLATAIAKLVECNVGSLVVLDGDRMVGILTERDILRACASSQRSHEELTVREHMTANVITGVAEDNVEDVMGLITSRRIRHLPIVQEGRLVGIISIGDVVKAHHAQLRVENHYLKTYIQS